MIDNKNIAIVGANSILGQEIYKKLCLNWNVFQVYHLKINNINNATNLVQLDEFLKSDLVFEVIYIISSVINFGENSKDINDLFKTNINLVKTLSDKFVDSKLIHASSVSVFELTNHVITEKSSVLPQSSYALSKLWAEQLVSNHKAGGVNIRISSLFGINMKMNTFLPRIVIDAINYKKITIFGEGSRRQNYISAKEAAEYFYSALRYSDSVPLLAVGSQSYSNFEVAQIIVEHLPQVVIVFEGEDDSPSFVYDNDFTKKQLNINHQNSFNESLIEVLQWIQKQY